MTAGAVVLVAVGVVVLAVLVLHHLLYRRPLPKVSGTVVVDGVRAPVHVRRDRHGVPHIDAQSAEDMAFALGFVHAQDRGWQLELMRRVAAGRVAEIAGKDGVASDRFVRRLGLMRIAEEEERLLEGEPRRLLDAYAAGVTAILCGGQPRPVEMLLVGIRPEPWRPAHSLAVAKLIAMGLACNWDHEAQRLALLQAAGPEAAALLHVTYPETNPTILASTLAAVPAGAGDELRALYTEAARWLPTGARAAASNSWVVDGTMTATGRPMLCNDPHLPAQVPSVWYEAHLRAGDDFESAGVGFPGQPFTVIGHNRRIAWGFTNSFADVQDLVIEEFEDATGRRHRTEDGYADTQVVVERIHVKGAPDVVEEVLVTRHGPVVEGIAPAADGVHRGLALHWTQLRPGRATEAFLALQRADGWDAFRRALNLVDGPSQNAVYADVDGHIGYFLTGKLPARRRRPTGLPVAGWTGEARFERFLDVDEVPQALDPPDHLLITANNRIVGDDFPHHVSDDYMNGYRALRIDQLLRGRTGVDAGFMSATQMDVVCPPGREVAALIGDAAVTTELATDARRGLAAWDGVMDREAAEPCVYEAFMRRLVQRALEPRLGEAWRLVAGEMSHPVFGFAGNVTGRFTPWLLRMWREGDTSVLAEGATWPEVAGAALEDAVADLRRSEGRPARWRWGRLHALPLAHALSVRRPLGLLLDAGRVEVGGDTDTVMQTAFIAGQPFETRAWAPSWRQVLDVGAWDACTGIHLPGQSGHPGSRHHRDLVDGWARNRQHPLYWSPEAVRAAAESVLVLAPPPAAAEQHDAAGERRAA